MTTLQKNLLLSIAALTLAFPLAAAAQMKPGMYEYTIKMNMPGGPGNMPAQTTQRCLGKKDLEGSKAYQMPQGQGSDCQIKDMVENAGSPLHQIGVTVGNWVECAGVNNGAHGDTLAEASRNYSPG